MDTKQGEWIEHDGGPCPVEPETLVYVRFRNGHVSGIVSSAGFWDDENIRHSNWRHEPSPVDIIAYRVVQS